MSLTRLAIEKKTVTYFAVILLLLGGTAAFFSLGQLEDPDFTVKTGMVVTRYPGASPEEVELEVTDRLEKAIQELPQLKNLYSTSSAGVSAIRVDIREEFWADRLPQVWDELRNKVSDAAPELPPGAGPPQVLDDFGFVYGFVLAVTGDGFTKAELDDAVDRLRKDLAVVPGVSRVELWGTPDKVIYLDVDQAQLSELGLTGENIALTLAQQNMVVEAGHVDIDPVRLRVEPTGQFRSAADIGDLQIRPSLADVLGNLVLTPAEDGATPARSSELIRIRDVGSVIQTTLQPPRWEMRWNGEYAQGISLANVAGGNIVETGRALDARLAELIAELPIGIEVHKLAWQSDLVDASIRNFMVNLIMAIAIVLVVLTVPMGWRMGVIIGGALLLTILGTFMVMSVSGIDLHRMSLGALVIALGMMVDNAIVVADGILARLQRGMAREEAAIEACETTQWPLLGATVVAVMAFYPIFASEANAGEYCRALFQVVAISLLLSWVIAMMVTPLLCMDILTVDESGGGEEAYGGRFYGSFRAFLERAIRARVLFMGSLVALLVSSVVAFGSINQMFFPDSDRAQLMIDWWAPEGTRIQAVSEEIKPLEEWLIENELVEDVALFLGQGPPRFYLPVDSEGANSSYAQLIVNTPSFREIGPLIDQLEGWVAEAGANAMVRVRKYGVGPADTWQFEARFTAPGEADFGTLRGLEATGTEILAEHPMAQNVRTDMRQRVPKVVPDYLQERARWADVTREDIARSTQRVYDGTYVGLYREGRDLLPIFLRNSQRDRERIAGEFEILQVERTLSTDSIPLSVVAEVRSEWDDPMIVRWNRRRAVTVQASPYRVTFPTLRAAVIDQFDAIDLPPDYEIFWDGEYFSTNEAQASLTPGMLPAVVIMLFIIVVLFNAARPPSIIVLTIPFAIIGISYGLLLTNSPFGFVALLGAMSLSGMMIKNAIVLLDQINAERRAGKAPYQAVIDSAISRLRPVVLAAATTVLGVIPLLTDVFWERWRSPSWRVSPSARSSP